MVDFEINKRLSFLIKEVFKVSPFAFSQKYNDNGGVKTSQIIRERNGLSTQMLGKIIEAYPEINQNWLLTGEGEMLKTDQPGAPTNTSSDPTIERLLSIIESQQRTIENFSKKM